jgi:hypothetical protein
MIGRGLCGREANVLRNATREQLIYKSREYGHITAVNSNSFAFKVLYDSGMWPMLPSTAWGWDNDL